MDMKRAIVPIIFFVIFQGHPALAQESAPTDIVDKVVRDLTEGVSKAAGSGVTLIEGLVGGIINPTASQFRSAVAERRFDDALALYQENSEPLRTNKDLAAEVGEVSKYAQAKYGPSLESAIVLVTSARQERTYVRDVAGYLKTIDELNVARQRYLKSSLAISDYGFADPLVHRCDDEEKLARSALRRDLATVYGQFPHERMVFSDTVKEPGPERELFFGSWDVLRERMTGLNLAETRQFLRNTSSVWSSDAELRQRVASTVWKRLAPADANPAVSIRAATEISEYGLTPADIRERPRLFVLNSASSGSEPDIKFTSDNDGSLKTALDFASTADTSLGAGAVLVEIHSTESRRSILEKKEVESQFRSGSRFVPNANYAIAQANCQRAQSGLAAQQARNAIAPARGWGILLQGLAEGLTSANVTRVCNEFAAVAPTIEEDVYSPYKYTVQEVELIRTAKGRIVTLDPSRGTVEAYPLNIEEKVRQKVAYGRKESDRGAAAGISDAELEQFASKPIEVDSQKILQSLSSQLPRIYPRVELASLLGERPADRSHARSPVVPAIADGMPVTAPGADAYSPGIEPRQRQELEATALDERMKSVVVMLNPMGSIGAGFYIDTNLIITNYHVVEGASTIELRSLDGKLFTGRVMKKDIGLDLALLSVDRPGPPAQFSQAILKAGDTVEAIGHPKGLFFSVTRGIVSAVRQMKGALAQGGDKALVIQTDASINPGNSGGPLFFKDRVVGVNAFKRRGAEGLNFAVHYSEVIKFLSQ